MPEKAEKGDKAAEKAEKAEARKIKALQRKAKKLAKEGDKDEETVLAELMAEAGLDEEGEGNGKGGTAGKGAAGKENKGQEDESEGRTVSAVITSHAMSRDVHIDQFTLLFHGHELLMDAKVELNHGRCVLHLCSRPALGPLFTLNAG